MSETRQSCRTYSRMISLVRVCDMTHRSVMMILEMRRITLTCDTFRVSYVTHMCHVSLHYCVTHFESHMWLICVTWLTHMSHMTRLDAHLLLAVWALLWLIVYTEWRRPIKYLKLQVIFRKRANNYRAFVRKMTYKDKASCGSSPPCTLFMAHNTYSIYRTCSTYRTYSIYRIQYVVTFVECVLHLCIFNMSVALLLNDVCVHIHRFLPSRHRCCWRCRRFYGS